MNAHTSPVLDRAERFRPLDVDRFQVLLNGQEAILANISASGLGCYSPFDPTEMMARSTTVQLATGGKLVDCGPARVVRVSAASGAATSVAWFVGIQFSTEQNDVIEQLLSPPLAFAGEGVSLDGSTAGADCTSQTLDHFHDCAGPDILEKCRRFQNWVGEMHRLQLYQRFYRVTLNGPIDSRVTAQGLMDGTERALLCFDSNSYLGLHLHPKVLETVEEVTRAVGYGTPSAQLLCGTNRYLRELEDELSAFHEREAAMVFPTGFAANIGILRALVRADDAVFRDQHAHASIHEGCRSSGAKRSKIFAHNDMAYLERLLTRAAHGGANGRLVITDGVFSMHGELAPLPDLVRVCRQYGATLMVDDAHGVGVLGTNGRGVEEHFDLVGSVDVLMGTLSKAVGGLGGYVCGDRALIDYLRWFAPSGLFTTSLPAAMCAGARTALEVIRTEPEHRARLWRNIQRFVPQLQAAGLVVSEGSSPIVTVFIGAQEQLWRVSRDLFDAGIKCGNVLYPAVARDACILRFTLNSRHSVVDLDYTAETLIRIARKHDIVGHTKDELRQRAHRREPARKTG
jgi:glycine C-acetyltransferase